jgi:hypothetical protein
VWCGAYPRLPQADALRLNGRRMRFTVSGLPQILEGQARRPSSPGGMGVVSNPACAASGDRGPHAAACEAAGLVCTSLGYLSWSCRRPAADPALRHGSRRAVKYAGHQRARGGESLSDVGSGAEAGSAPYPHIAMSYSTESDVTRPRARSVGSTTKLFSGPPRILDQTEIPAIGANRSAGNPRRWGG